MPKIEYAPPPAERPKVTPPHVPLRALRVRLGLKQTDVCDRVSLILGKSFTKGALSAIETGHRGASAEALLALQTALGLGVGDLVTDYQPGHTRRSADIEDDAA